MIAFPHLNYLAIIVATLVGFALGGLWYSPAMFARPWVAAIGKTREELGSPARAMGIAIITSFITALALALMLTKVTPVTWMSGLKVGLLAGVGIYTVTAWSDSKFTGANPTVVWIGVGYRTVMMVLMSLILAAWQ
jgi:hypothetical protein